MNGQLVVSTAIAFGPIRGLPVRGTGLGIAFEMALVDDWLVEIHTLLRGRDLR